ncbi:tripartite tricarboxylate transporter TctB family protein [Neobacillus sp. 3P2-tot-E-2]|uniref:tripartite tricarboxylate transporter TctB family protein n=1 Tax=Neobacillus sp. 3P2-tot-E-2 TaxID=3132212 RepID=UPI0039A0839A
MVRSLGLGFILAIFFLVCSFVMLWQSLRMGYYSEYGPGPGFLPLWINGLIIILSVLYIIHVMRKGDIPISKILPKGEGFVNVMVSMGAPILFLLIVPYSGFITASTITLFILFIRGFKWYWSLGYSAILSFILFWIFGTLLQVPIPVNVLGW